jgi:hypothetical protein
MIILGEYQIGYNIKPLDPKTVSSVVQYGTSKFELVNEAKGQSLIYSQLYPFEGLQNYTSGIIHHVRLTGEQCFFVSYLKYPKNCYYFLLFFFRFISCLVYFCGKVVFVAKFHIVAF